MAWTWQEIEREWLLGNQVAVLQEDVVRAFDTAERLLGREWVDSHRLKSEVVTAGTAPTLGVVSVGQKLRIIEGCPGAPELLTRLQRGDRSAYAELSAIYLCASDHSDVEIELGCDVVVSGGIRKPDFRLRRKDLEWTYVEVAAPDLSEAAQNAQRIMESIGQLLSSVPTGTAIELFLRREPGEEEVSSIVTEMSRLAADRRSGVHDMGDLALIAVNQSPPSELTLLDYGEPVVPRLGLARFESDGGPATKRVSVRYPYTDARAEAFLTSEARQLPREGPGMVMLSTSGTRGAFKAWRSILSRRLQPGLHTRVSAICLFEAGLETTVQGEAWVPHTSLISNTYAKRPVAEWLLTSLRRFEAEAVT